MKPPGWMSPLLSPIEGRQNEAGPLIFSRVTWSNPLAPALAAQWKTEPEMCLQADKRKEKKNFLQTDGLLPEVLFTCAEKG